MKVAPHKLNLFYRRLQKGKFRRLFGTVCTPPCTKGKKGAKMQKCSKAVCYINNVDNVDNVNNVIIYMLNFSSFNDYNIGWKLIQR